MSYYVRNLPHWHPDGVPLFVTWRLFGSLPRIVLARETGQETYFTRYDRELDAAKLGPVWLSDDRVAQIVADALEYGQRELRLYNLDAWVIMPNHVHIVILPAAPLARITKAIKGFTAKQANITLGRAGPFWQYESYDSWIRDRYHLSSVVRYVELNPVKAGFVDRAEDWRWSSKSVGHPSTGQEAYFT